MLSCWQVAVAERPTFEALRVKFEQMLTTQGDNTYIDFSINPEMQYYNEEQDEEEKGLSDTSSLPKTIASSTNSSQRNSTNLSGT